MGIFKILGGAALGVTALVATPILAPAGVLTSAGLAIGTTLGAAAGVASSLNDEREHEVIRKTGYDNGYEVAKAEDSIQMQKLEKMISEARSSLDDKMKYERYVIAMYAVALAAAHCNGNFADEQKEYVDEFLLGESKNAIPDSLKSIIEHLYNNPPSFNSSMAYVNVVNKKLWTSFDIIIEEVINADGILYDEEIAFNEAWKIFKAA